MTALRVVQRQIRTLLTYTVYRSVVRSSLNVRFLKRRSDLPRRLPAEGEVLAVSESELKREAEAMFSNTNFKRALISRPRFSEAI